MVSQAYTTTNQLIIQLKCKCYPEIKEHQIKLKINLKNDLLLMLNNINLIKMSIYKDKKFLKYKKKPILILIYKYIQTIKFLKFLQTNLYKKFHQTKQ